VAPSGAEHHGLLQSLGDHPAEAAGAAALGLLAIGGAVAGGKALYNKYKTNKNAKTFPQVSGPTAPKVASAIYKAVLQDLLTVPPEGRERYLKQMTKTQMPMYKVKGQDKWIPIRNFKALQQAVQYLKYTSSYCSGPDTTPGAA
jgi:hypothetical protein